MAENVVLQPYATLQNSSILATANANNAIITSAFADCLSLSGNQPNQMQSILDMNFSNIINLPAPSTLNSPIRLVDFQQALTGQVTSVWGLLGGPNTWTAINTFTNTTQSTSISTGSVVINGGLGVAKNISIGGTLNVSTLVSTGVVTVTINNLGGVFPTTGTDGVVLQNTTAATAGATVQISPDIHLSGTGWNTTAGASQVVDWIVSSVPVTGTALAGKLSFGCQLNGAGYNSVGNLYYSAGLTAFQIGNYSAGVSGVTIFGANSGTSGGALIGVQNGTSPVSTANVFLLGNKSAIYGTAYDGTPVLFTAPASGSNPFQIQYVNNATSVGIYLNGTAASSTTTGTLQVNGGIGANALSWLSALTIANAGSTTAPSLIIGGGTTGLYSVSTTGLGISVNGGATPVADYGITTASTWTHSSAVKLTGLLTLAGGANAFATSSTLSNYAGAVAATLGGSAPTGTSVPTKWIAINDNGTTHYLPLW